MVDSNAARLSGALLALWVGGLAGCEGSLSSNGATEEEGADSVEGSETEGSLDEHSDGDGPLDAECDPEALPTTSPSLLLPRRQLFDSVAALVGAPPIGLSDLPSDTRTTRFAQAEVHQITSDGVRQMVEAWSRVASEALAQTPALLPCPLDAFDSACRATFVEDFLSSAFRRPAEAAEIQRYEDFFLEQEATHGTEEALALFIEVTLHSPHFLYRFEETSGPPNAIGLAPLDGHSLATRLSYFLTGGPPDAELWSAAAEGRLNDPAQIEAQARRLLDSPEAEGTVRFLEEFLELDFELITKGTSLIEGVGTQAELSEAWKVTFEDFVRHVMVDEGGSVGALLTSSANTTPADFASVYPDSIPRAGLLTQPGLLAALAHDHSSPVLRGVFIRDHLLCDPVPPPPPGVEANIPPAELAVTTRDRYANLEDDPSCRGCHKLIHSIGFALEEFDALGRHRLEEGGAPVDASGEFVGFDDPQLVGTFSGAAEMAAVMAGSERVSRCLNLHLYEAAMARVLDAHDECAQHELGDAAAALPEAANLKDMIVALVTSERFITRAVEGEPL